MPKLRSLAALLALFTILFTGFTPANAATFKDINTSPQRTEIAWAAATGITTGYADGTYRPNQSITRGQMAAFLYRAAGSPAYTAPKASWFKDVKPGAAFYKEIHWVAHRGISFGWSDATYRPNQLITRDQMAAFLYRYSKGATTVPPVVTRFNDVKPTGTFGKEIYWAASQGVIPGKSKAAFKPADRVSRGEMAGFLHRAPGTAVQK